MSSNQYRAWPKLHNVAGKRTSVPVDGEALRARREALGWTRYDLRQHSSVSEATIVRAERGEDISPVNLHALSKALNLPVDDVQGMPPTEAPQWFTEAMRALHAKLDKIIENQENQA